MQNKTTSINKFNKLIQTKNGLCLYNKNDIYIGESIKKYSEYATIEDNLFKQICNKNDVIIEVGANIGTHTQVFSKLVGNNGAVIAYEPQRIVFQTLCANIALNSILNVYTYQEAIGSQEGFVKVSDLPYNQNGILIKQNTLNNLTNKISKLKLIKIDGNELDVLKGANKLIEQHKPILYVKNDDINGSKELIELIQSYGYKLYWHICSLYNPNNIKQEKENIFKNIFSINMLCIKSDTNTTIKGLKQIDNSSYHPTLNQNIKTKISKNELNKLFKEAINYYENNDIQNSIKKYEHILTIDKNNAQAYCALGVLFKKQGDINKAINLYIKAINLDPSYPLSYHNLGNAFKSIGKYNEALNIYAKSLKIYPDDANVYNNIAMIYESLNDNEKAILAYKKAINIDPKFSKAINNLAVVLYKQKQYEQSVDIFKLALKVDPKYYEVYSNLGAALNKAKRYDEAIEVLQKAIKYNPKHSGAYTNLGNVYNKIYEYKKAVKMHQKAIELEPNGSNAYSNIGTSYKNLGQMSKAIESYKKAIELDPDFVNAHFDLSTVYLALKDFKNGWEEYEWRFKKDEMKGHILKYQDIFTKPRFDGIQNIEGKKLLIHTEQGFGDSIMFAKFVDIIKDKYKCQVILQCRDELRSLFENSFKNVDQFYSRDSQDTPEFDYQYSMLSLPYLLNMTTTKDIPNTNPYLVPFEEDELKIKKDKKKIDVGICWSASVTGESYDGKVFDIEYLRPLIENDKFNVYTLQVGIENEDIKKANLQDKVIDLTSKLSDFNKTAYLISQLDLVISSDTSVAHLAGAINKEVIVPLQKIPDWRWENKGDISYWYPSSKLFRQKTARSWDSVFQSIYAKMNKQYKVRIK